MPIRAVNVNPMAKMDFIFTFKRITNIYHHLTHKTSSQIKLQESYARGGGIHRTEEFHERYCRYTVTMFLKLGLHKFKEPGKQSEGILS